MGKKTKIEGRGTITAITTFDRTNSRSPNLYLYFSKHCIYLSLRFLASSRTQRTVFYIEKASTGVNDVYTCTNLVQTSISKKTSTKLNRNKQLKMEFITVLLEASTTV